MKILLTGYGPFGEHAVNPSWQVVKAISKAWDLDHKLVVQKVPVSYDYVDKHIPPLLKEFKPDLVIHVGVGHPGKVMHLETCAHSSGYIRPDIDGCCGPCTSECVCLKSCLDIDKIVEECSACPDVLNVVKSTDAGRYLCEYIFYTSLHVTEVEKMKSSVLFVHVPYDSTETITVEMAKAALLKIIKCCLEQASACESTL